MIIDNSGNLGIGTTNPVTKLHMSSGTLTIDGSATNSIIVNGNVAIGTTTATTNKVNIVGGSLTVNPTGSVSEHHAIGGISIDHGGPIWPNRALQIRPATTDNASYVLQGARSGASDLWYTYGVSSGNYFNINRLVDDSGGSLNGTDFVLNSNGNIGIGTTNPNAKLESSRAAAAPATSGSGGSTTAFLRLQNNGGGLVGDMGLLSNSPFGMWLQSTNRDSLNSTYPILLNPNGGNVGIGTTNPTSLLHLYAGSNDGLQLNNGTVNGVVFNTLNTGMTVGTVSNHPLYFYTYNNEVARINAGGNVGIGTSGNKNKLDVNGTMAIGSYAGTNTAPANSLIVSGNVGIGTTNPAAKLDLGAGTTGKRILTYYDSGSNLYQGIGTDMISGPYEWSLFGTAGPTNQGFITIGFCSTAATPVYSEKVRITAANGNVGIGTTNPTNLLHLYAGSNDGLRLNNGTVNGIVFNTNNTGMTVGTVSNHPLYFYTYNTEVARISAGGNVGIGTTNPIAKLHVSGDNYALFGPNSSWNAYLTVGGNGRPSTYASIATSNGNLHLDAANGAYNLYLNYYGATGGIYFGNGASGTCGSVDTSGNLSMNGTITAGSLIAGNSMTMGNNIYGSAVGGGCGGNQNYQGSVYYMSVGNASTKNMYSIYQTVRYAANCWVMLVVGRSDTGDYAYVDSSAGWSGACSRKVKQNIQPVKDYTYYRYLLNATTVYTYNRKDSPNRSEVGMIAEEIPEIMGSDGYGITATKAIGFLMTVAKGQENVLEEQSSKIQELENTIKSSQDNIKTLENKLQALEAKIH